MSCEKLCLLLSGLVVILVSSPDKFPGENDAAGCV